MFPSNKLVVNRTSREIGREIKRLISKTTSSQNIDGRPRQDDKPGMNLKINSAECDSARNKWSAFTRQNNIRALSTIQTASRPPPTPQSPVFSKEESREFMAIFPDIVRDLTDAGRHTDIPEVTKRFAKVLQYNVPTGKKTRGLSTVIAYKMLEKPENLTPENVRLAGILGWCVELLRSYALMADDLIDGSEMRRNAPCWYRAEGVGNNAMLDLVVLENSVYSVLRKHFSGNPSYVRIVELFHDVSTKSAMGKSLEGLMRKGGLPDLRQFTMKNYDLMVKYRSGFFSFQLPVGAGMWLAQIGDKELHRQANTILLELGRFFKIKLQASLLIMDDLMDKSQTRRGQPCWYRQDNVGMLAINDCLHVEVSLYSVLRKYISHLPCYVPVMELFHDVNFKTNMGQSLDAMCLKDGRPVLSQFTMKRYSSIVKYKTSYYTFQLPVSLAMYLADMYDPEQHRQAQTILMEIGEFFQIQDDFLDAFGDSAVTGKIGTDIKEGKCTWLAVVALQRATPSQRRVMEEHYGRPEPESTRIVKELYVELGLPATFAVYEEESFNIIRTHIQQISKGLPHDLFFKIMKKIYKRDS